MECKSFPCWCKSADHSDKRLERMGQVPSCTLTDPIQILYNLRMRSPYNENIIPEVNSLLHAAQYLKDT